MNNTNPRQPKNTKFRIDPVPLEGKRLKLAFWWLRPIKNMKKVTTITTHINPVNKAGGSTLSAGASVIMMEGV